MVQDKLLNWYEINQRVLPFRINHDPYRIWVSEIMLQQTQVSTVISYYNRFMERFPSIFDLAKANEEEVFKLWEGLGYYSRAKNLLKCGKIIAKEYNGIFPKDHKLVLKLPGIGPYTAGAVLSIGYNMKYPAVDGNVMRVISRIYNIKDDTSITKTRKVFEEKVLEIMPDNVRDFNQALMELGALVCMPKNPKCIDCPVNIECEAYRLKIQEELPVKTKKIKSKKLSYAVGIVKNDDKFLLTKNDKGLLSGLWGFPGCEGSSETAARQNLLEYLKDEYDFKEENVSRLGEEKHVFTHKTWMMVVYSIEVENKSTTQEECISNSKMGIKEKENQYSVDKVWLDKCEFENYPIATAYKKILKFLKE